MQRIISLKTFLIGLIVASLAFSGCSFGQNQEAAENTADQKKIEDLTKELEDLKDDIKAMEDKKEEEQKKEEADKMEEKTEDTKTVEETKPETKEVTKPKTSSTYSGPSYIRISSPEAESYLYEAPIRFTGQVSPNTQKVSVKATSPASPNVDDYILQNYKAGSTTFSYGASPEWNNLVEGTNTYVFTAQFADGGTNSTSLTLYYVPGGVEMGKPVIYLYPEHDQEVFVNVEPTNGISVSEPAINDGWNVMATPESVITNLADGLEYPYLFWEGYAANFVTPEEGFVVEKDEVARFFDEKLGYMGLNEKEIADFKEFWVPILSEKPYYFITFIDQDKINEYAPLTVEPKPDSVIRVFFDYRGLDEKIEVPEQTLTRGEREGFTVTEWGGSLYR